MRTDKTKYYLQIADAVCQRSTCLRRGYGAIIVKNDEIIATGYNGAPRGRKNCDDLGYCVRMKLNIPHGQQYEICRSTHAEQNAIISASRRDMLGATMYLVGREGGTGASVDYAEPCSLCKRMILNAGIDYVVSMNADGTTKTTHVSEWVVDDDTIPSDDRLRELGIQ